MYISAPIGAENFFWIFSQNHKGDLFDDFSFFSSLGGDPSKDPPPVITPLGTLIAGKRMKLCFVRMLNYGSPSSETTK